MDTLLISTSSSGLLPSATTRSLISPKKPFSLPPPPFISSVLTKQKPQRSADNYDNKNRSSSSTDVPSSPPPLNPQHQTPRPRYKDPSPAAAFCIALDNLINNFIDPPHHRPSLDPRHVLSDNWAPVNELPPTPCPIIRGSIPACLRGGAYIRNGPNPQHLPRGPHHLFDGDGMLNALLLSRDGTAPATLCSRYVRTYKYLLERDAGGPVLPNVFSGFNGAAGIARGAVAAARILTGQMNPAAGVGLANTSLAFFGGRLYALGESDLPYAVRLSPEDGDITTLGRCDFEGRLSVGMTAHPKKDPVTGEVFAFRYGPMPPFLTYFRFDAAGNYEDVPIFSFTQPSMVHDFAVTENFVLFPDIQIVMKPMDMVAPGGGSLVGSDRGKVPRIGVLPKYARSDVGMRWFEVPGFNIMHAINAWEEEGGDVVVLVAPNVLSIEHALERMELVHSSVEMVRIDLRSGDVWRTPLSAENLDFGVIHPSYVGRKNRFGYLGVGNPMPKISGVRKLDFALSGRGDCVVASRDFGPGCFGGEPFFVPAGKGREEEDDGYLVSYLHDEWKRESKFIVMDASSPQLDVVAEVMLPRRVPYGFHGLFVTQAEIMAQQPY